MVAVKFWKYSKIYGIEVLGIIMDSKPVDLYSYFYNIYDTRAYSRAISTIRAKQKVGGEK